jgi:CubicO group peptidase (beta-lactamase class C family)
MPTITRREFAGIVLAGAAASPRLRAATSIEDTLRTGIERRKIPAVTAMVAGPDKIIYSGAFGKRDGLSGMPVRAESIFRIASMTKAITTTAALQLVEQGKVSLTGPVSKYLPQLAKLQVLEGFDSAGKPILKPEQKPIELHHLLTHTSGFVYPNWDAGMTRYNKVAGNGVSAASVAPLLPLAFEPGTRWQYGPSIDWAGKLVEAVSGLSLEEYFQRNILGPLGMVDTTFILPESKFSRLVSTYRRQPDGKLKEEPRQMPAPPKEFNGGGGLYSTAPDYARFTQMILRKGRAADSRAILAPKTVDLMEANQTGSVNVQKLVSVDQTVSADVDLHPGAGDKYTFGFLMNPVAYEGGRSAGSLGWAGIENTFYWIDPKRGLSAVIMMQFFPFVDSQAVGLLHDFEHAVYA